MTAVGMLHVDGNGRKLCFAELFVLLRDFMREEYVVGATGSDVIHQMLSVGGISPETAYTDIVTRQLQNVSSEASSALVQSVRESVALKYSRANRNVVFVRNSMSVFEQTRLQDDYPELKFDFTRAVIKHDHALAAAYRVANEALLHIRIGYNDQNHIPHGTDVYYKDVGGSLQTAISRKRYNTHSCLPTLSIRDASRRSSEVVDLPRFMQADATLRKIFSLPERRQLFFCKNKAQDCNVRASYLLFLDSIYDMTNTEVADAMDAANARIGYATMLFSSEVLTESTSGFIPAGRVKWEKREQKIVFHFDSDYSFAYEHDLNTYIAPVVNPVLISSRGQYYTCEIGERRGPYVVMKIIKVCEGFPESSLRVFIPTETHLKEKIWVTCYLYEPRVADDKWLVNFKKSRVMAPRTLWNRLTEYAYGLTLQKFSFSDIFAYARSCNTRTIVNGTDVLMKEALEPSDLLLLCQAVYIHAFVQRYNMSAALGVMTDVIKSNRYSEGGFFATAWKVLVQRLKLTVTMGASRPPKVSDDNPSYFENLYLKMLTWLTVPEQFDIKIQDAVEVTDYVTEVERCRITYADVEAGKIRPLVPPPTRDALRDELIDATTRNVIKRLVGVQDSDSFEKEMSDAAMDVPRLSTRTDATPKKTDADGSAVRKIEKTTAQQEATHGKPCECDCDLVERAVLGDGNCLFYCLLSLLPGYDVKRLKEELAASPHLHDTYDPAQVKDILTTEAAWGDDEVVYLFSIHFEKTICLHSDVGCVRYGNCRLPDLHIRHKDYHFTILAERPKHVEDPAEVARVEDLKRRINDLGLDIKLDNVLLRDSSSCVEYLYNHIHKYRLREAYVRGPCAYTGKWLNNSARKLLSMMDHDQQLRDALSSADTIIDIGGAPGGYVQVARSVNEGAHIVTVSKPGAIPYSAGTRRLAKVIKEDILDMDLGRLPMADVILSDVADENSYRDSTIFDRAINVAMARLLPGGSFVVKHNCWWSESLDSAMRYLRGRFRDVHLMKPSHSFITNSEVMIICHGYGEEEEVLGDCRMEIEHSLIAALQKRVFSCDFCIAPVRVQRTPAALDASRPVSTGMGVVDVVDMTLEEESGDYAESVDEMVWTRSVDAPAGGVVDVTDLENFLAGIESDGSEVESIPSAPCGEGASLTVADAVSVHQHAVPAVSVVACTGINEEVRAASSVPTLSSLALKVINATLRSVTPQLREDFTQCVSPCSLRDMCTKVLAVATPSQSASVSPLRLSTLCAKVVTADPTRVNSVTPFRLSTLCARALGRLPSVTGAASETVAVLPAQLAFVDDHFSIDADVESVCDANAGAVVVAKKKKGRGLVKIIRRILKKKTKKSVASEAADVKLETAPTMPSLVIETTRNPCMGLKTVGGDKRLEMVLDISLPRVFDDRPLTTGLDLVCDDSEYRNLHVPETAITSSCLRIRDSQALAAVGESSVGRVDRLSVGDTWTDLRLVLLMGDDSILSDRAKLNFRKVYKHAQKKNMLSFDRMTTVRVDSVTYMIVSFIDLHDLRDVLMKVSDEISGTYMASVPDVRELGIGNFVEMVASLPLDHKLQYNIVTKTPATYIRDAKPVTRDPVHGLWEATGNNYVGYKPEVSHKSGASVASHNAMREIREYWKVTVDIVMRTYREFYSRHFRGVSVDMQNLRRACDASAEKFCVCKFSRDADGVKKTIFAQAKLAGGQYEVFYDGNRLVSWNELREANIFERYYITGKSLALFQHERLYESVVAEDEEQLDLSFVKMVFVEGVPGCGKTHRIINNVPKEPCKVKTVPAVSGGSIEVLPVLVLTPTRESADEIKTRLVKQQLVPSARDAASFVMTIDSYLINRLSRGNKSYELLILEEALMLHAGQIAYALLCSNARSVLMIGDPQQIPFINRTPQCEMRFIDPLKVFPRVDRITSSVSFRCTLSVAATLSAYYKSGMQSVNDVLNDCSTVRYGGLAAITKLYQDEIYLTFKQSEKADMIRAGFVDTMTVHEFQGKQADHVVVVRTTEKKEEIYKSRSHALVALSRHRKTLRYVTPVFDDALALMIRTSEIITRAMSRKYLCNVDDVPSPIIPHLVPESPVPEALAIRIRDASEEAESETQVRRPITLVRLHNTTFLQAMRPGGEPVCVGGYRLADIPLRNYIPTTEKIYSVVRFRNNDNPTRLWLREDDNLTPAVIRSRQLCPNFSDEMSALQVFIDQALPGNSVHSYQHDPEIVETSQASLSLEDTTFNQAFKGRGLKSVLYDRLHPVLRTSLPVNRPDTQLETLLAMVKRNQAVPDLAGSVDLDALSDVMLNRFIDLLVPEARELLRTYEEYMIQPNTTSIKNWLLNQDPLVADMIEQPSDILATDHSTYNFKIKPNVKPQLDTSAPCSYQALQTIAYSEKWVNANYCPIFKDLTERLLPLLRSNIVINIGMSVDELSDAMTRAVKGRRAASVSLEVDMSKYDKSQGELMLLFEEKFLRLMGVHEDFVRAWVTSHVRTVLLDRKNKVSCEVSYQRKSGDASTFIMNTVFLMSCLATLLPVERSLLACFGGDDSLIFGDEDFNVNLSEHTASLFNLESKYFRHYAYPYFCSKFILRDSEGTIVVVPDPVKLVTKLGRRDLANFEHAEEYRVSLADLTVQYGDQGIYPLLSKAVAERYGMAHGCDYAFNVIYHLCRSQEAFKRLYYTEDGAIQRGNAASIMGTFGRGSRQESNLYMI